MQFSLLDFIPNYPSQDDPDIQSKITAKKEFNEFEATETEVLKKGDFFKHQKIIHRYMRQYSKVFLIHEAGTGKSCTFIGIPSFYFENSSLYRKAYILERNETTSNEFRKEIHKCSKQNAAQIKEWYEVTTYQKFVDNILGLRSYLDNNRGISAADIDLEQILPRERIESEFSDCIFLIDEAHNLRNSDSENVNPDVEDDAPENKVKAFQMRVSLLKKLFRESLRAKVAISTATPMINSSDEIITFINLLSDEDLPEHITQNSSLEELEPYIRGKISYVRALDTGVDTEYIGISRSDISNYDEVSSMNVVPLYAVKDSIQYKIMGQVADAKASPFRNDQLTASTFVFPYPESVSKAIKPRSEIADTTNPKRYTFNDDSDILFEYEGEKMNFRKYVSDFERLKGLSIKFAFIIKNELLYAHSKGRLRPELIQKLRKQRLFLDRDDPDFAQFNLGYRNSEIQDGNAFIYTSKLTSMGAAMLGLIMSQYGFTVFNENEKSAIDEDVLTIEKDLRIVIFTATFTPVIRTALAVFGHRDNYNGEYIQCIIGSSISRDGINLLNSTRFYMTSPEWHYSGMYQAMSRVIRATSHEVIKEKNPGKRVVVNMYFLCMIYKKLVGGREINFFSSDNEMYAESERKDRDIRETMRKLKIIAFDCMLNYNRNYRPRDKDGSMECDYQECRYQCFDGDLGEGGIGDQGITVKDYDLSTYNIIYPDEIIEICKEAILERIRIGGSTTFEEMIELLYSRLTSKHPDFGKKDIQRYVFEAVERQVASKEPFLDSYGYKCYLQTDDVNIYIQRAIPRKNDESYGAIGLYNLQLVGWKRSNLASIALENLAQTTGLVKEVMQRPATTTSEKKELMDFIFSSVRSRQELVDMMEKIMIEHFHHNNKTEASNYLINDYYRIYIFDFDEPVSGLASVKSKMKKTKTVPKNLFDDVYFPENDGRIVIVHVLDITPDSSSVAFYRPKISDKIMKVLHPDSDTWKPLQSGEGEKYLYPEMYKCYYQDFLTHIPLNKNYVINHFGDYKIAQKQPEETDARRQRRGAACETANINLVISYLNEENLQVKDFVKAFPRFPRPEGTGWQDYVSAHPSVKNTLCQFIIKSIIDSGRYIEHPIIYPSS